eukprot:TRINITY_DN2577_c0_g1_i1.p1 TRINITY_DN2577_c0_g1~~TRINITY_DN2577_c0_g1_i1.p1  ORF type:complete len:214 (+),score=34.32 TRINITY_DN2577_c0_g1_i1:104-745(+)
MAPGNDAIGGKPILTYLDIGTIGRGEVVRLFLFEAGIEFEDIRIPMSEWPAKKAGLIESCKNVLGNVPILELNGTLYVQSIPIIRYFSRKLGKYLGQSAEDEYLLDKVADVYSDWRASWASAVLGDDEAKKKHEVAKKNYYACFESAFSTKGGPFLLGKELSYTDIALYQVLNDDGLLEEQKAKLTNYPLLKAFSEAFEARPSVAPYLSARKT